VGMFLTRDTGKKKSQKTARTKKVKAYKVLKRQEEEKTCYPTVSKERRETKRFTITVT